MKLANKTAIITGGGTGMGKVTALLFAREGANVIITGRREAKLKEAAEEAAKEGLKLDYLVSDVSSEEDCKAAVDYAVGKYGRIDILFNNAGVLYPGTTHETDTETWDKIFDTNVKGTYWMSKYTIPVMLENGGGSIVNNSSVGGLNGFPGLAAYTASKGAVTLLTKTMALEYADKGIKVNAICPGTIETPMVVDEFLGKVDDRAAAENFLLSLHPIGRFGKPEEVAHTVLFLCDDNVGFMTGNMVSIDGGWNAK
jgi:NAD(P)-dependent dehydrogenase (short-subunit alcohol dehydrogenase family)